MSCGAIVVAQPDRFTTMCFEADFLDIPNCNATTVPANGMPKVVIWTMLGDRAFLSTLVRVNGHLLTQELDYDTMVAVVNLAELFPAEAVDGRVHPGRYELQIELASVTETHVITAR